MACLRVKGPNYIRVIPESPDGNVRGMLPTEEIIGTTMLCGPYDATYSAAYDLDSLITPEGVMVGNIIKKVTNVVGLKQCLACTGRQVRYNAKGLAIQKKIRNIF